MRLEHAVTVPCTSIAFADGRTFAWALHLFIASQVKAETAKAKTNETIEACRDKYGRREEKLARKHEKELAVAHPNLLAAKNARVEDLEARLQKAKRCQVHGHCVVTPNDNDKL